MSSHGLSCCHARRCHRRLRKRRDDLDRPLASTPRARQGRAGSVPTLRLGRLAVDQRYASLGIGTTLAAHVLATAVELDKKTACHAVVMTATNEQTRTWWQRFGFSRFAPDEPDQLDLYRLTSEIEATLRKIR